MVILLNVIHLKPPKRLTMASNIVGFLVSILVYDCTLYQVLMNVKGIVMLGTNLPWPDTHIDRMS